MKTIEELKIVNGGEDVGNPKDERAPVQHLVSQRSFVHLASFSILAHKPIRSSSKASLPCIRDQVAHRLENFQARPESAWSFPTSSLLMVTKSTAASAEEYRFPVFTDI